VLTTWQCKHLFCRGGTAECVSDQAWVLCILPSANEFTQVAGFVSWDGSWSDSLASDGYGGTLYMCSSVVNGQTIVTGVYSEVDAVAVVAV